MKIIKILTLARLAFYFKALKDPRILLGAFLVLGSGGILWFWVSRPGVPVAPRQSVPFAPPVFSERGAVTAEGLRVEGLGGKVGFDEKVAIFGRPLVWSKEEMRAWAGRLGFTGEGEEMEGGLIFAGEGKRLSLNGQSRSLRFNASRLVEGEVSLAPSILLEKAEAFLQEKGLLDQLLRSAQVEIELIRTLGFSFEVLGEKTTRADLYRVSYRMQVEGRGVVGEAGEESLVTVIIDRTGHIQEVRWVDFGYPWEKLGEYLSLDRRTVEDKLSKGEGKVISLSRRLEQGYEEMSLERLDITDVEVGYFWPSTNIGQTVYPVFVLKGSSRSFSGVFESVIIYLPAV